MNAPTSSHIGLAARGLLCPLGAFVGAYAFDLAFPVGLRAFNFVLFVALPLVFAVAFDPAVWLQSRHWSRRSVIWTALFVLAGLTLVAVSFPLFGFLGYLVLTPVAVAVGHVLFALKVRTQ